MKKLILADKSLFKVGLRILKWYFSYYFGKRFSPIVVAVFTTNSCNLKCDICSIWRGLPKASLSLAQLKELVDATSQTACYISFSGGEPLMVPEINSMVEYASSKIPYVHLVSNGYLVTKEIARELKQAGLTEISFSLDGDQSWHDKVRGCQGSYERVINAIECFKSEAPKIRIVIDSVVYPNVLEQTRKAVEITKQLGVFHKVQPVNKHFSFSQALSQPPELDFSSVNNDQLKDLINFLINSPHVLNSSYFLKQIPNYFKGSLICYPTRPSCILPYFFLEVNAYGKVSPCMYGTGWEAVLEIDSNLRGKLGSSEYKAQQKRLKTCKLCDKSMFMCYWEPLVQFPLIHAIKYGLKR